VSYEIPGWIFPSGETEGGKRKGKYWYGKLTLVEAPEHEQLTIYEGICTVSGKVTIL
jgi:hypothetical protein